MPFVARVPVIAYALVDCLTRVIMLVVLLVLEASWFDMMSPSTFLTRSAA